MNIINYYGTFRAKDINKLQFVVGYNINYLDGFGDFTVCTGTKRRNLFFFVHVAC